MLHLWKGKILQALFPWVMSYQALCTQNCCWFPSRLKWVHKVLWCAQWRFLLQLDDLYNMIEEIIFFVFPFNNVCYWVQRCFLRVVEVVQCVCVCVCVLCCNSPFSSFSSEEHLCSRVCSQLSGKGWAMRGVWWQSHRLPLPLHHMWGLQGEILNSIVVALCVVLVLYWIVSSISLKTYLMSAFKSKRLTRKKWFSLLLKLHLQNKNPRQITSPLLQGCWKVCSCPDI